MAPDIQNHTHSTGFTAFCHGKSSKAFILIILWNECKDCLLFLWKACMWHSLFWNNRDLCPLIIRHFFSLSGPMPDSLLAPRNFCQQTCRQMSHWYFWWMQRMWSLTPPNQFSSAICIEAVIVFWSSSANQLDVEPILVTGSSVVQKKKSYFKTGDWIKRIDFSPLFSSRNAAPAAACRQCLTNAWWVLVRSGSGGQRNRLAE